MIAPSILVGELRQRAAAWKQFFTTYPATHFVTLAYNNRYGGTASVCNRQNGEIVPAWNALGAPGEDGLRIIQRREAKPIYYRLVGEPERLPTSGVPVTPGDNRLPIIRRVPLEQVHTDLDRLHRNVDRKLFGTNFNELPDEHRTAFIGFVEHPDSNVHVHLLWRVPEGYGDQFTEKVEARWKAFNHFHSTDVQQIRDGGAASYTCKDHVGWALESEPALFVFSRTRKRL